MKLFDIRRDDVIRYTSGCRFFAPGCRSSGQCPQVEHDPPAHPEHDGAFVPATLFPPLWALQSDSLRLVRRLPQEAHAAGSSARLIGRSSSNSRRQASQAYS
jgi:hypothetical protein